VTPEAVDVWTVEVGKLDAGSLRSAGADHVRATLSRYADVEPGDWRFERGEHGRPELAAGQTGLPLRFNLSHADGLIACAVSLERDVGVDVENIERARKAMRIAERYFSPGEVEALRALCGDDARRRFLEYWTLRECYVKARGLGIAVALRGIAFRIEGGSISMQLAPDREDDPAGWQFELHHPTSRHVLAVAARRDGAARLRVRLRAG
jgi:4'-phosphopantetheinyl transferase